MDVILEVFVIFAAAKLAGEIFVRLRLPAIAGELLVGVLLGPHILGWIQVNQAISALAQLGIVVLLFCAGLEMRLSDLLSVGKSAGVASLCGILAAAASGFAVASAFGLAPGPSAVVAVALCASSVGIAARAFADFGALGSGPAKVVIAAAVVDDIVVLVALPMIFAASGGKPAGASVWIGAAGAVAFIVLVAAVGSGFVRKHHTALERLRTGRAPFVAALLLCLGLAALAERVGLAALVGAFLAGMLLAETKERYDLEHRMEPLFDLLVPFFFVVSAARLDLSVLAGPAAGLAVALSVVTVLAKFAGCSAGALGLRGRDRLSVGAGMVPRGEVTIAVAGAGLAAGVLGRNGFSALVAAVFVSTLVAPLLIRVVLPGHVVPRPQIEVPPEASGLEEEGPGESPGSG